MISERYLWRLKVRISWRNVLRVAAVMAVRRRLMKAVFFLRDESRVFPTGNKSMVDVVNRMRVEGVVG